MLCVCVVTSLPVWKFLVNSLWDCCLCCIYTWGLPGHAGPAGPEVCWAWCCWGCAWRLAKHKVVMPFHEGVASRLAFKKWCRHGYCLLKLHKVLAQLSGETIIWNGVFFCWLRNYFCIFPMGAWCLDWHCSVVLKSNNLLLELLHRWEEAIFRFLLRLPLGYIYLATRASRSWFQKMPGSAQCFPCDAFFLLIIHTLYLLIVCCSLLLVDSDFYSSSCDFLGNLKSTQEGCFLFLLPSCYIELPWGPPNCNNDTILSAWGTKRCCWQAAILFSLAIFCFLFFWQCHVLRRKGLRRKVGNQR